MDIVNVTKEERILINKAKAKALLENPEIKNISYGRMFYILLKKYIKGGVNGRGSERKN